MPVLILSFVRDLMLNRVRQRKRCLTLLSDSSDDSAVTGTIGDDGRSGKACGN